jgi:hypothetical protein
MGLVVDSTSPYFVPLRAALARAVPQGARALTHARAIRMHRIGQLVHVEVVQPSGFSAEMWAHRVTLLREYFNASKEDPRGS